MVVLVVLMTVLLSLTLCAKYTLTVCIHVVVLVAADNSAALCLGMTATTLTVVDERVLGRSMKGMGGFWSPGIPFASGNYTWASPSVGYWVRPASWK